MRTERLALLLLAALAAAGCGAQPEPAPAPEPPRQVFTSNGGAWEVSLEPPLDECRLGEPCRFFVRAQWWDGAPPPGVELEVDAAMPDHRHGLNARPTVTGSVETGWEVEGLLLHMPGYWEVYFDFTAAPITERAQVAVER